MERVETPTKPTTLTPERRQLYERIAMLSAGRQATDVIAALAANLSHAVGFVTDNPDAGERLLAGLVPIMVAQMRDNWPNIMVAKAQGAALTGKLNA